MGDKVDKKQPAGNTTDKESLEEVVKLVSHILFKENTRKPCTCRGMHCDRGSGIDEIEADEEGVEMLERGGSLLENTHASQ